MACVMADLSQAHLQALLGKTGTQSSTCSTYSTCYIFLLFTDIDTLCASGTTVVKGLFLVWERHN